METPTFFIIFPGFLCSIFFKNSKYETVTPPPFTTTSGKMQIFLDSNIFSPWKVVGPFAASTRTLHSNFWALYLNLLIYKKKLQLQIKVCGNNFLKNVNEKFYKTC